MKKQTLRQLETRIVVCAGILTFGLLMILFAYNGLAPFGSRSLAVMDADIQYLDLFSYLKNVLAGKSSLGYTFGKTLGGSGIAIFSYYLSSPFNLLVVFFSNQQLPVFFDLIVALKLTLAAVTFAYFSVHRFPQKMEENAVLYLLLSVGYGLSQYALAQSSNIMWLDGIYMLPLILLQVYEIVQGKRSWSLTVLVGLAIVFNWYSAGIDCLFTAFWFLLEFGLRATERKPAWKEFLSAAVHYVAAMLLGVMLSAVLFLPTIGALKKSTRGSIHLGDLKNLSMLGELPTAFQNYTYGSVSDLGSVALFCGSLTIILVISIFFNKELSLQKRVFLGGVFTVSILLFYWNPLYVTFSLFQWVSSYQYRYSYLAIFALLFLALYGGLAVTQKMLRRVASIAIVYSLALITLFYLKPVNTRAHVYATAGFILLTSGTYLLGKRFAQNQKAKRLLAGFLVVVVSADLMLNADLLIRTYSTENRQYFQAYYTAQKNLIDTIQKDDPSFYRISQTTTRSMGENGLTAYYNEGLAYNYASISGYTSSPDDIQREFLDRLGYPINGENMCITNTSILSADSLLGVRYILSPYDIQGLEKISGTAENGKAIYQNPYAFPMAFTYDAQENHSDTETAENPFLYQNALYQQLFAGSNDLYTPLEYTWEVDKNTLKIHLSVPSGKRIAVYGNLPWNAEMNARIYVNGQFMTQYACWLSPTVFYLPVQGETCEIEVQADSLQFDLDRMQFYALDLETLEQDAELANARSVDSLSMEDGKVQATVTAKSGERLFLSIAADDDWNILLNGKPADIELIGNCLYSIALEEGENTLSMQYHVRYQKAGLAVSLLALVLLCGLRRRRKKNAEVQKEEIIG